MQALLIALITVALVQGVILFAALALAARIDAKREVLLNEFIRNYPRSNP